MKVRSLLFSAVLIALTCTVVGQSKADQIDALITKFHDYNQFTGTVLVSEHGKVIYKKGFGLSNQVTGTKNRTDTRYRLASVTKQFTAMLIMQLVASGKLSLHAPVTTWLPDYPAAQGSQITIHHLLTHTSGIPSYTSYPNYRETMVRSMTPAAIVDLFKDAPLEFSPGAQFTYSNSGYVLLGHIIETVSGTSYEQMLNQNIFAPLQMRNSGYEHAGVVSENKAVGYDRAGSVYTEATFIDMSIPFSAGALYSTVEDMHLWNEAQYTDKLVDQKYLDMMFDKHITTGYQHYGYGWEVGTLPIGNTGKTVNTIGHSGGINGFVTQNIRIPEERSSIILLSNSTSSLLRNILIAINGILHDESFDQPKQSVAYVTLEMINAEGIARAAARYDSINKSADYYLDESEMNHAGYALMQSGKLQEAATVFKWNVDAFPQSFNVYDSYGEALLALGDTSQSVVNYKKSLEINPNNEYGLKALRSMGIDPDEFIFKVPAEKLELLTGEYVTKNETNGKEWKISFALEDGILVGNDRGYRYKLAPQSEVEFINPDDGAVLKFDTSNASAITLSLFGFTFRKL